MTDVEYVELSTQRVRGGLAGRPLELVDIKNELLILLAKTTLEWTLVRSTWTVDRIFDERPVEIVRVSRPPHLPEGVSGLKAMTLVAAYPLKFGLH